HTRELDAGGDARVEDVPHGEFAECDVVGWSADRAPVIDVDAIVALALGDQTTHDDVLNAGELQTEAAPANDWRPRGVGALEDDRLSGRARDCGGVDAAVVDARRKGDCRAGGGMRDGRRGFLRVTDDDLCSRRTSRRGDARGNRG